MPPGSRPKWLSISPAWFRPRIRRWRRVTAFDPLAYAAILGLCRSEHGQNAQREVQDRPGGSSPPVSVYRCRVRHRSGVQQYRGVVPVDPGGGSAAQGPAILSLVRRECGERIHRVRVRAESLARHVGGTGAPSSGRRGVRAGREGKLPTAQLTAELRPWVLKTVY